MSSHPEYIRKIAFAVTLAVMLSAVVIIADQQASDAETAIQSQGTEGNIDWKITEDDVLILSKNPSANNGVMNNYSYNTDPGWVRGAGWNWVRNVIIEPEVTTIGDYAFDGSAIESISIPNTVTSIGLYAFKDCKQLETVTIPDSVTNITKYAFTRCNSLWFVMMPSTVTTIGERVFSECTSMKTLCFTGNEWGITSIGRDAFSFSSLYKDVSCKVYSVGNIADGKLDDCCGKWTTLTYEEAEDETGWSYYYDIGWKIDGNTLTVKKPLWKAIGIMDDFYEQRPPWESADGWSNVTNIVVKEGVYDIGAYAFYGCKNIVTITIGADLHRYGPEAFAGCTSVREIAFTGEEWGRDEYCDDVFNLGEKDSPVSCIVYSDLNIARGKLDEMSSGYTSFEYKITPMDGNIRWSIDDRTLTLSRAPSAESGDMKDYSYTYPLLERPTWEYDRAFREVTKVVIKDGVTSIGEGAFYQCSQIRSVVIPGSVTEIGKSAFQECSRLRTVDIQGSGLSVISEGAFTSCTSLSGFVIPDSVSRIERSAFFGCSSLEYISIPELVESIAPYSFYHCSSLKSVSIDGPVQTIGVMAFCGCSSLQSFVIPDTVFRINGDAFARCTSLKEINIPSSVTSVGEQAFMGCSALTHIDITSLKTIGENAFLGCTGLKEIVYNDDWKVESIGANAFNLGSNQKAVGRIPCEKVSCLVSSKGNSADGMLDESGGDSAQFTYVDIDRTVKCTWVNYDGTVLQNDENVPARDLPAYSGLTPVHPDGLTFCGWSESFDADWNLVETAVFQEGELENLGGDSEDGSGSFLDRVMNVLSDIIDWILNLFHEMVPAI